MNKSKWKLWLSLSLIGFIGALSMLFSDSFLSQEQLAPLKGINPLILKLLLIINPTTMVLVAAFVGSLVYDKVGLRVPILERLLKIRDDIPYTYKSILIWGSVAGVVAGLFIIIINLIFTSQPSSEFLTLSQAQEPHIITRLLYGGLVEEILMRFGLMSVLVWLIFKIMKDLKSWMFWVANIVTALIFAVSHFPLLLSVVPHPTVWLYLYIILANGAAGVILGYMYMKRGLECAMWTHLITHVTMFLII